MAQGILSYRFIEQDGELKLVRSKKDKRGYIRTKTVIKLPTEDWGKLKTAFFDHYRLKVKQGWMDNNGS